MSIKYMDYIIFRYAPYGYVHSKRDNSSIQILVWEGFELNQKILLLRNGSSNPCNARIVTWSFF